MATDQRLGARPRAGRLGAPRLLGVVILAVVGLASIGGGLVGVTAVASRGAGPLLEAGAPAREQRFAFDRSAWAAVKVDDLFPPTYTSTTATPLSGDQRDFTRIGVARPASCRAALDPALVRLLSVAACGPVLRAGYTDATRTLVATVGVAVLGTSPAEQRDVSAATQSHHDDLGAHPLAFPGTPAAGFGAPQRLAFRVFGDADTPFLAFAVVGFSDGRPASADPSPEAVDQSGAELTAVDLEELVNRRMVGATDALWARAR